jgi:hypothetical protein
MEVKSTLEQAILECFRTITESQANTTTYEVDEDLIIEATRTGENGVTIEIKGCTIL